MCETVFLADRKHAPKQLGRVLVLGLGKSGRAAVEYCRALLGDRVETLAVAAGAHTPASEEFAEYLRGAGVAVAFGDDAPHELARAAGGRFEVCVASPGISQFSAFYQAGALCSGELISEVEFAWRESPAQSRWVAITGTNGKTTATALVEHLLNVSGLKAKAVGNIGDTCLEAVASQSAEVYVAEVSSYQLASTINFAPNVAVILNVTPDHLHWHKSFDAYRDAKFKVLANLSSVPNAVAVLDATDDVVRAYIRGLRTADCVEQTMAYIPVGTKEGLRGDMRRACGSDSAAFLNDENMLVVAFNGCEQVLLCADELQIKGEHNVSNALAAVSAVRALGVDASHCADGLRSFKPLEHRIEPCGSVQGVACYNDSKATNVDATLKAFAAFPETRPLVLLGGEDKGTDLTPLVVAAQRHASTVVCFGAAGERFEAAFKASGLPCEAHASLRVVRAKHMEDALDAALAHASAGDVVLLSPACASFDEFHSFEERGCVFKSLVAARAASLGV